MSELRALFGAYLERVAAYQADTLLSIVYWTVVALTAIALRLSGRRLLPNTFGSARSHWITRPPFSRDSISRQY